MKKFNVKISETRNHYYAGIEAESEWQAGEIALMMAKECKGPTRKGHCSVSEVTELKGKD